MDTHTTMQISEKKHINYNHISYALYVVGLFSSAGLLWLVPIVMNYFFRSDAPDSWVKSHYQWQISTFWSSVFFVILGWALFIFGGGATLTALFAGKVFEAVGWSLLFLVLGGVALLYGYLWNIYRVVRGWIALADKRAIS